MAVAGVVAVVGAVSSYAVQKSAQKDQKKAAKRAERIASVQAQRERVAAVRSQRIQQAAAIAQGTNAGVAGSSAVQGANAALGTSTAVNIGVAGQINGLQQQQYKFLQSAADKTALAGQIGSLTSTAVGGISQYRSNQANKPVTTPGGA